MTPTAGLAALTFFLADVETGLGPFLATWLASAGWDPARIGVVMTLSAVTTLVCNCPAGILVDRVDRPRFWLGIGAAAVVLGTLALLPARGFVAVAAAQIGASVGSALMLPALMALTLGLVGKDRFPRQQGRNEAWNHAGNVAAAGMVALATFALGPASAFWVLAGMAAGSLLMLPAIPGGQRADGHVRPEPRRLPARHAPAGAGRGTAAVPPGQRRHAAAAGPAPGRGGP